MPGENLSVQRREPTNSTHIWRRIWWVGSLVGGECSHHCAITAPQIIPRVIFQTCPKYHEPWSGDWYLENFEILRAGIIAKYYVQVMLLFVFNRTREIFGNAQENFPFTVEKNKHGGPPRGGVCSLVPNENLQLFPCSSKINWGVPRNSFLLSSPVPRNSARCSLDHQKFRSVFPWSPKIFLTVPYNSFGEEQNIWFAPRPGPEKWEKL